MKPAKHPATPAAPSSAIPPEPLATYQLSLSFSEAVTALSRVSDRGGTLDRAERDLLMEAAHACQRLRAEMVVSPEHALGRVMIRVAQPLFPKAVLVDHLSHAEDYLWQLAHCHPGNEGFVLGKGRLAWLIEFLSDCCILLLREIATQHLPSSRGA